MSFLIASPVDKKRGGINKSLYTRYGKLDNRVNKYEIPSLNLPLEFEQKLYKQMQSVVCFTLKNKLVFNRNGQASIAPTVPTLGVAGRLATDQKFRNELVLGHGTGFLVAPSLVLTSAHCVCQSGSDELDRSKIRGSSLLFDYKKDGDNQCKNTFEKDEVFTIKRVVAYGLSSLSTSKWEDWALIELDRPVPRRKPIKLSTETVTDQMEVYMIGHPTGLPIKFTKDGEVKRSDHPEKIEVNLDAFSGNSGSPVLDRRTRKAIGILTKGNTDYVRNPANPAEYIAHYPTDPEIAEDGYEHCQRISVLSCINDYIKAFEGDRDGQYKVGCYFLEDQHHNFNLDEARAFFLKAALSGNKAAQSKYNEISEDQLVDLSPGISPIRGLTLLGTCFNEQCSRQKEQVFVPIGMGSFNIPKEIVGAKCPQCAQRVHSVTQLFFWNCSYTIDAQQKSPQVQKIKKTQNAYSNFYIAEPITSTEKKRSWEYYEAEAK